MEKRNLKDSKGMLIAGIFSSQTVDSSGEVVSTEGLDISSMEEGKAVCNYEHLSASDGVGKEVIGTVVYVHKVFTYSDCEDDIQKKFFKENREKPYLFGIVRLFDAAGHKEAGAIAAFVRDSVKHGDPLTLQFSIEGSTVTKEGNLIKESIARRVAATLQAANKNCSSKLIADPNAPDGYDKVDHIGELAKKEAFTNELAKKEVFIDPMYRKIGSYSSVAPVVLNEQVDTVKRLVKNIAIIKALKKAMTAGCGDAAPSSLTQGAALQKEDLDHKVYSGTVLAAARDYDWANGRKDFKKYLKSRLDKAQLPEVSDQFLDHFTDIAEAVKLKKSVDDCAFDDLQKKEKPVLSSPDESVIEDDRTNIPATPIVLTFRGKKLRTNPTQKGISLDTKKGVLRTPYGTLKLHNPATESPEIAQHFQNCLNSPHTHKIMSQALKGWHTVHKLAKAGELPEEIPMTATILAICSGNRPVPLTELQTVRIVDAMRNSGIDVRKPGFESILPHLKQLDKPDVLPDTGKESVRNNPEYYKQSGELRSIAPLMEDTVKNLSQYYKAHAGLVDLVHRHGTDMASGIRELMDSKNKRVNWNNRRAAIIKEKGADPGEYKGFNIPGIKLKTGLYAYGMMGGGNCLDRETEALTRRGWIKGFDLKGDDVLLTKNPETGELEWQEMTSLNLFPDYEGDLVEFKSRSFDAITTPQHRWLVTSNGGIVKEKTSDTITFNGDRIHRTGSYVAPETSGLTPDEAELLGWFVTDGNYKTKKIKYGDKYHKPNAIKYIVPGKYAQLYQSISGNFEKCRRIDYLLERLDKNGEVTSGISNGSMKVWRLGPTLTNMLVKRSPNRYLTVESLLDLNKECLERLRESMVLGDGWVHQHKAHWTAHQAFCTGRKEQAEAFQVLLTMTGSSSVMEWIDNSKYDGPRSSLGGRVIHQHGIYIVRALVREYTMLEPRHRKDFKAKMGVWCPTVPNSFFVARRNGKVWITGNSVVPDTHFIRHMFGLDTRKDADTLLYLKKALWNPTNYHVVEGYNKWYRDNHPAHKWMVNHPEFGKMFDKPEEATFPAFWANWMNVPAYEEKLGTSSRKQAHNQGSTHAPYWAAIEPHVNAALNRLGKSEDFDTVMPLRAALIMQHYVKDYGEIPAQMLYYTHLVPKLLECAKHRQTHNDATSFLKKAILLEQELLELRKDIRNVTEQGHSVEMPEVYKVEINNNGKLNPAGRFMTSKGKLYHLEDNHGILNSLLPEGDIDANTISKIHGLMTSPHLEVSEHPLKEEERPKAETPKLPHVVTKLPEPTRPGVFSYFRPGMSRPHTVEFTPHGAALDGKSLSHDELALMLQNARNGVAKIKWGTDSSLAKREATEDLMNADEALQHVRAAVQAGHLHPSIERALTKHIYVDPLTGIGNKYAATQFRKQGKPGVYASIDANDFKSINDRHGHDAGDSAIMALGNAIKSASEKVGTTKTFRPGGDEFFVHAPTHEDMSKFLRHVREHVSALPPIAGVHKQSISAGIGENFAKADEALGIAKQGKLDPVTKQRLHAPGQTPNLGYSLYPGHEGHVFKEETKPSEMAVGG